MREALVGGVSAVFGLLLWGGLCLLMMMPYLAGCEAIGARGGWLVAAAVGGAVMLIFRMTLIFSAIAFYGMVWGWGWPWWGATLIFLAPMLLSLVVGSVVMLAREVRGR